VYHDARIERGLDLAQQEAVELSLTQVNVPAQAIRHLKLLSRASKITPDSIVDSNLAPPGAGLRVKRLPLNTLRENVIILSRNCHLLRPDRFAGIRKLQIRHDHVTLIPSLDIAEEGFLLADDEVGVTDPAFSRLGVGEDERVEVSPARASAGFDAVRAKVLGEVLTKAEMTSVITDISAHRYSDMEIAAFLVACANFLTTQRAGRHDRRHGGVGCASDLAVTVDRR
jgi:hypothetical protein